MTKSNAIRKAASVAVTKLGPAGLTIRRYSPELLLIGGIVGVITGTVLACKATLKVPEQLDILEDEVAEVKEDHSILDENDNVVQDEDSNKDLAKVYLRNGGRIIKLYAPASLAMVAGIACMIGSHNVQSGRIAGLAAAYSGVSTALDEYRSRVREELGDDKERDIYHGIHKEEVEEIKLLKNGKEKKTKKSLDVLRPENTSLYTFIFDDTNPAWSSDTGYNKSFLVSQQTIANDKFQRQGYLFLNDVLESLGFDTGDLGYTRVVGWAKGLGDDFVDFGLFEAYNPEKSMFINGMEPAIWLDFNVDGYILDKVGIGLPAGTIDDTMEFERAILEGEFDSEFEE